MIPIAESEAALVVAMADPLDDAAARALEFALDKEVHRRVALPADIEAAYERLYGEGRSTIDRIYDAAGDREDDDRDADLERLKDWRAKRQSSASSTGDYPCRRDGRLRHPSRIQRKPAAAALSDRRGAA